MKICKICGKKIVLGVNGCTLMDDCFDCHGGYPKYPKPTTKTMDDGAADYWEGQILARQELYDYD